VFGDACIHIRPNGNSRQHHPYQNADDCCAPR
jgi:hypothetical protein